MQYTIRMTARALEQVASIADYIAHTLMEPDIAERWFDTLMKTIRTLSEYPGRFRTVIEEPWHGYGLRQMTVQNYNVFYRIDEAEKTVIVTAVLYYRSNRISMLMDMPLS